MVAPAVRDDNAVGMEGLRTASDRTYAAVWLHLQGFSYREIGERIGVSKTTVYKYLHERAAVDVYNEIRDGMPTRVRALVETSVFSGITTLVEIFSDPAVSTSQRLEAVKLLMDQVAPASTLGALVTFNAVEQNEAKSISKKRSGDGIVAQLADQLRDKKE